jgi:hypothetical protein
VMPAIESSHAQFVAEFVSALNKAGFECLSPEYVPVELRSNSDDQSPDSYYEWEIRPSSPNSWIEEIETRAGLRFPSLFRYFVTHYKFAGFDVDPILFFANTGHAEIWNDISYSLFHDKYLFPTLLKSRMLQFGRQSTGNYDPSCFDLSRGDEVDAPIVQVDHEEILIHERLVVVREIAPSFRTLIQQYLSGSIASM